MQSKIIVMLTHNDQTVSNALTVFEQCKDLPVDFWGFKDVGLPKDQMRALHGAMKAAGKRTFLEVVTYTPEACMQGAKLAIEFGFDCLMGTLLYPEVWDYLKDKPIEYFPFVGDVTGSPSILRGTARSMIEQANVFHGQGIHGVDILAYRLADGDPEALARDFVKGAKLKVVIAGSIGSAERIAVVNEINPYGFTMGSALFTENFVKGGSFRENLEAVLKTMDALS